VKQIVILSFFLIISTVSCFFVQQDVSKKRDEFLKNSYMTYTLPSKIIGPAAMEFKGIVSDFLFLKVSTFFGGKFINKEMLSEKQAEYAYDSVDVITDLDPWFWDAYLFADMLLTWDFGQIDKANDLLFKAKKYRTTDFKVPYYIGFNYFYFLKDTLNGSKYLMEASMLPGSPSYLPALATRFSMYQNQFEPAILFLENILKNTQNPAMAKQMETRLKTLILLEALEKKVHEFKNTYGFYPKQINELVEKKIIKTIPKDPYGGELFITKNGRVFTTSKMIYKSPTSK